MFFKVVKPFDFWNEFYLIHNMKYSYLLLEDVYFIEQNLTSIPLILKSLIYSDPALVFFLSLFHLFQNLEIYSNATKIGYMSYSQSITTYILRLCERKGIINIISQSKEKNGIDLKMYLNELGSNRNSLTNMYKVLFTKNRSLDENDIDFVYSLLKLLKINRDKVIISSKKGILNIRINFEVIRNNLINGSIKKNLTDKNAYYKLLINSSLEDISLILKK